MTNIGWWNSANHMRFVFSFVSKQKKKVERVEQGQWAKFVLELFIGLITSLYQYVFFLNYNICLYQIKK